MSEPTAEVSILRDGDDVLLRLEDVTVEFKVGRRQTLQAVAGVTLDVVRGETLGLVGESGCGKSTLARAILQLPAPSEGSITFDGVEVTTTRGESLRRLRPRLQMIFQDSISALNPRRKVRGIVAEPLSVWRTGRGEGSLTPEQIRTAVNDVLDAVGLDPEVVAERRPNEFSGGQCQRISIARAVVIEPDVLICDEPVSALDVSVQADILNLLEDMKERYGLTMVFVAHDLAVVKSISDRVAVMYLGKICELGPAEELFARPAHPYTLGLLASIPRPDPTGGADPALGGELPSPLNPPSGCRFRTRCPQAQDICAIEEPQLRARGAGHFVACHFPLTDEREGAE